MTERDLQMLKACVSLAKSRFMRPHENAASSPDDRELLGLSIGYDEGAAEVFKWLWRHFVVKDAAKRGCDDDCRCVRCEADR